MPQSSRLSLESSSRRRLTKQTMDGSDLKVSDSSGSDRNPLRLPSERLLRRIETSGDLFAAAPEAFGLSEVVLGAHVALAQKLRRADASQLKIASKVVGSFVPVDICSGF